MDDVRMAVGTERYKGVRGLVWITGTMVIDAPHLTACRAIIEQLERIHSPPRS